MKEKGVLGTSIHLSHRQGRGAYAELRGSNCRPTTETPPARSTGSRPPPRASAETGKVLEIHGHVDNEGGTPLSVGDKGHGCVFAVSSSRACGAQRNKRRTHSSLEVSSPSAGAPWANRSPPPPRPGGIPYLQAARTLGRHGQTRLRSYFRPETVQKREALSCLCQLSARMSDTTQGSEVWPPMSSALNV